MRRLVCPDPRVTCIGVASSLGAPFSGTASGPDALRANGIVGALSHQGWDVRWADVRPDGGQLEALLQRIADETYHALSDKRRFLTLGGDHSVAAGSWRGVGRALGKAPGLIWIDAHLDAHTPSTSPSGNRHGMPLAALLGEGNGDMTGIDGPPLDPARVMVIGAHSFEAAEFARLARLGVRVCAMNEVRRRGLHAVMREAIRRMGKQPWGLSLDLDAIDPGDFAAVGTPVGDGISMHDLMLELRGHLRHEACVGIDIVEYDPSGDPGLRDAQRVVELVDALASPAAPTLTRWETDYGAHNYAPLPVVLTQGQGAWLEDVAGHRYLDLMSAYSATSFGHGHPRLLAALQAQAGRLAITSRAFGNDRLPLYLRHLARLSGYEKVLPVNTGLEAVETAIKVARKWAYVVKGVAADRAEIIACEGNFHGRSVAIVGLSTEPAYREGFGPFPPGLRTIPYGDADALEAAITPDTAAFLVEPIQGEGGIVLPPAGYLARCAAICRRHNVLLIADEIQTGLGRTGKFLACEHDKVRPDAVLLGKALGGGLLPVSAFLTDARVMSVIRPGDHGSTFGGNLLACAVAMAALDVMEDERLIERSARLGMDLLARLEQIARQSPIVRAVRGRGLFAGIELVAGVDARRVAVALLHHGVLTKDTHATVLRLAPPLTIAAVDLDWGLNQVESVLVNWDKVRLAA